QLAPGEPQDLIAPKTEEGVAGAIVLERLAPAMALPAVGLDHQSPIGPQEVDGVRADRDVDLGDGQVVAAADPEHSPLEPAALRRAVSVVAYLEPEIRRLA